jgi:citrate synthase
MGANDQADGLIGAAEAARRLGVKPATLYAYVSRGVLRRKRAAGGRQSLFEAAEIDELARRGRPRRPPSLAELVIESEITAFVHGRPHYRGRDAVELAATWSFEDVASWLWTGERSAGQAWTCRPEALAAGIRARAALPASALPMERLPVIVAALAGADPLRLERDPAAVTAAGRGLIAGMVDALPPVRGPRGGESTPIAGVPDTAGAPDTADAAGATDTADAADAIEPLASRLWARLTDVPPRPGLTRALRAALVLLADHELAASTLAVRVAASVRADPYAVVATGLGVLGGTLHGGASLGAETMFDEIARTGAAGPVIGGLLRRGERIPGLGHNVYRTEDPRATALFELLRTAGDDAPAERLDIADTVLAETRRRRLPEPNIDFALATLTGMAGMIRGAGETIFAVARSAGWIAHALEEYRRGTPLRPRAVYTGPSPEGGERG